MTAAQHLYTYTLPAAYALLPSRMNSPEASVMLMAIGFQESKFTHRHQIGGPAVGFWQFETIAVSELLRNPSTNRHLAAVVGALRMSTTPYALRVGIEWNDTLAACVARLNLFRHKAPLPQIGDISDAWSQYTRIWAPGKPRPNDWPESYAFAREVSGL